MTAVVDRWADGYQAATDALNAVPGPLLRVLLPRLLNISDDPHDDPAYTAGYRQALTDASRGDR